MLSTVLALLSVALYLGAATRLMLALRHATPPRDYMTTAMAGAAVVLHAVVLEGMLFLDGGGLDLGFFHALSLAAWVIVLLLLLLSLREPVDNLGIGLYPIAAVTLFADLLFGTGEAGSLVSPGAGLGLELHVLFSIVAHAVLSLAAMQAVVVGIQHRMLHEHHPVGAMRALPPLYVMELLLFRMIATGFVLLTVALAAGFLYLENMFAQDLAHKTILSLIAWALFGTLLVGHHVSGWRGPTAVRFTLGGFILLVLGYFGSKLVLELILARP